MWGVISEAAGYQSGMAVSGLAGVFGVTRRGGVATHYYDIGPFGGEGKEILDKNFYVIQASSQQFSGYCWQATCPTRYLGLRWSVKHPLGEALPKLGNQRSSGDLVG